MTLVQLFTAIANAIRAKTGSSETITAEDFPTEINSIPSGGSYPPDWSEIGYQDTPQNIIDGFNYAKSVYDNWDSTVTSLTSEFASDTNLKYMPLVNTSNVTSMYNTFVDCSFLEAVALLDTHEVTNMQYMFLRCTSLKTIPLLDTSNVTTMYGMFSSCTSLKTIPQLNTSNNKSTRTMFSSCDSLETVPLLDTSNVTNMNSMFSNCPKLSNESLNNILAMCIGATSYTGTKTLKQIGLSSAQATICQSLSNWSALSSAGWTTGY